VYSEEPAAKKVGWSGNALVMYCGGFCYKSHPRQWLSSWKFSWVSSVPPREYQDVFQTDYNHLLDTHIKLIDPNTP